MGQGFQRSIVVLAGMAVLLFLPGCRAKARSLTGLECTEGQCVEGYSCDAQTNLCITEGDPCSDEGRYSTCDWGSGSCSDGCRTCEEAAWTVCQVLVLGDECTPGATECVGDQFVVCDARGFIDSSEDCGTAGCNQGAGRCNDCVADGTTCEGMVLTTCGPAGLIESSEDCDDQNLCTTDSCSPAAGCVSTDNTLACDDGDPCTLTDACDTGACVGTDPDLCDDGDPCTVDACVSGTGCSPQAVDCSGTAPGCQEDFSCNPVGVEGNCAVPGAPRNEGGSCADCQSGDCLSCSGGTCLDTVTCDGGARAPACDTDLDCQAEVDCQRDDCASPRCEGASLEHQACADFQSGTSWGAGNPCESVTCVTETGASGNQAVGEDCQSTTGGSTVTANAIWVFNTASQSGTPFNLWMRNAVDSDNEDVDSYGCTLTGVTGAGGPFAFTLVRTGVRAGRHGPGCPGYTDSNEQYCWMAADGDTDAATFDPIPLDSGAHTLDCSISMSSGGNTETGGFDGILFTADLAFIPDEENGPGACGDSDTTFTDGGCTGNDWGPNTPPSSGLCTEDLPANEGGVCDQCPAGAGNCSVCAQGSCFDLGVCDGATEPCLRAADCQAYAGVCTESATDCEITECAGATPEHQACADSQSGTDWGPGNPCQSVTCLDEDGDSGGEAVGADCYARTDDNTEAVEIEYQFNTASPDGTPFRIWLRNVVDTDLDPMRYACTITGVTGSAGPVAYTFTESDILAGRNGPGCTSANGANGDYCWLGWDGDQNPTNPDPLPLDQGLHTLYCFVSYSDGGTAEAGGYDGIIFTADLGFVPDEEAGPGACGDSDTTFTGGSCSGNNWGPNAAPLPGWCALSGLINGALCSAAGGDTCCASSCVTGTSPGVCP